MQYQDFNSPWGRFITGECLETMKAIPDGIVDMVLCDLPYGTTQNKWDSIIPLAPLWAEYKRICKGAIVLTASQPFTSKLVANAYEDFKYAWVWEKGNATGHLNAKKMPMKLHEDILVFKSLECPYYPQDLQPYNKITRRGNNGTNFGISGNENLQEFTNYPRSILRFDADKKGFHPTQKPVLLWEYLIKTYTNENELVLDNTAGSGTTAIAAINTNRQWICIEQDQEYAAKALDRISKHGKDN